MKARLHRHKSYALGINPHAGNVAWLSVPSDPPGINLVHTGEVAGFGMLSVVPRGDDAIRMAPSGSPMNVEAVHMDEERAAAPVESEREDGALCRNIITGHSLRYEFGDEYFDVWLEGDLSDADQVALDMDIGFMDLRPSDPPEFQYNVQCPYVSHDRTFCYVYFARPRKPDLLVTALTPGVCWRIRYGRNGVRPMAYRMPMHTMLGFQMVARFHSRLDPAACPGPIRMGVRVSFPSSLPAARSDMARWLNLPVLAAPALGARVGATIPYRVEGSCDAVTITAPDGCAMPSEPRLSSAGIRTGNVTLDQEGFYRVTATRAGRSSDLTLYGGADWLPVLDRSLAGLRPPPPGNAEGQYWMHAMCLRRQWLGPVAAQDAWLYDALVRVHMQELPPPQLLPQPPEPTEVSRSMPREDGHFLHAPVPFPHEYLGKRFSPFHLFRWDRVQDAFVMVQTYLLAARAFACADFIEHAVRIARAHLADNMDASGRIHRIAHDGRNTLDYTTVIAPIQALVDLVMALRTRGDDRAGEFHDAAIRATDYLVRRGLDFPTEGVPPHVRWTEDGSIACTALSLLDVYCRLDPRPEYLQAARRALDFHEAWGMDVPDARMNGSSHRYWETQWENEQEGRAINSGHPWTLWRAEALYDLGWAAAEPAAWLKSWNGFLCNRCKFQPDGRTFACFTPDFLPDRPRSFALYHRYPNVSDGSIAFYLWPRLAETWLLTAAVIRPETCGLPERGEPVGLNAALFSIGHGVFRLQTHAPFFRRLFLDLPPGVTLHVPTRDSLTVVAPPPGIRVIAGTPGTPSPLGIDVQPVDGVVTLAAP